MSEIEEPLEEEWDPLQAEYDDLREQELERARLKYRLMLERQGFRYVVDEDGTVRRLPKAGS